MSTTVIIILGVANLAAFAIACIKECVEINSPKNSAFGGAVFVWSACTVFAVLSLFFIYLPDQAPRWAEATYTIANAITVLMSIRSLFSK